MLNHYSNSWPWRRYSLLTKGDTFFKSGLGLCMVIKLTGGTLRAVSLETGSEVTPLDDTNVRVEPKPSKPHAK